MRVFLTGATGFIGAVIVPELLGAGHQVLGLTRSDKGEAQLRAAGAEVHRGQLEDLESLRAGAAKADGVIHCAFDHDFSNFAAVCEKDRLAIGALASALQGSKRPLVVTSGVGLGIAHPGEVAREDVVNFDHGNPRKISEQTAHAAAEQGVNTSVVRLPQVHDTHKQGLITYLVTLARERKLAAYPGEGSNRYAAAHVTDVARLYRLALERAEPGAIYHAVAEEGVPVREVVEVVGAGLGVPVKAVRGEEQQAYFGWMNLFATMDLPAHSAITRQKLGWEPTGPGLLEDLKRMDYSAA